MMLNVRPNRLLLRAGHFQAGKWPGRTRVRTVRVPVNISLNSDLNLDW